MSYYNLGVIFTLPAFLLGIGVSIIALKVIGDVLMTIDVVVRLKITWISLFYSIGLGILVPVLASIQPVL